MEGRKCSNQLALIEVSTTLHLSVYTRFPALPDLSTLFKATCLLAVARRDKVSSI
jgi:hypothetical protein